ncbi:MAG: orotidine 5'-phosphate decarboxylase / HUMPS family protein, partial [Melioribacteraceae bacterium]
AITLHPYMGYDSVKPFLEYKEKLNFILALTSNSGSADFEKLKLENGKYLYQRVIEKAVEWNANNNCGLVFGATNIDELIRNIDEFRNLPVLLPGVGAQGGSLEDVVKTFSGRSNLNFIINISRALIYTDDSPEFGRSVNNKIREYNTAIHSSLSGDSRS